MQDLFALVANSQPTAAGQGDSLLLEDSIGGKTEKGTETGTEVERGSSRKRRRDDPRHHDSSPSKNDNNNKVTSTRADAVAAVLDPMTLTHAAAAPDGGGWRLCHDFPIWPIG